MTVLMTADTVGGVWTYALDLARALSGSGIRVVLATMGDRLTAEQRAEAWRRPNLSIVESTYRLEWMPDPWRDVDESGEWLLDLAQQYQPDIVHLNGYSHGALPFAAPVLVVAHSCVLSWWHAVRSGDAPASWDDYRAAVVRGLKGAALVIAPSRHMAANVRRWYGFERPVRVIPNGCDGRSYEAGRQKRPVILSAGRLWDEAKNLAALEAAAPRVDWPVYAAGDAGSRAVGPGVRQLGRLSRSDLAEWMSWAAVYALPARYEPFGLSILEAACSGCALVLGRIPSLVEIWGSSALFVDPDDVDDLTGALTSLTKDTVFRDLMASLARQRAQRYTLAATAAAYVATYRELAGLEPVSSGVHECAS
jgi:glycogen synthase